MPRPVVTGPPGLGRADPLALDMILAFMGRGPLSVRRWTGVKDRITGEEAQYRLRYVVPFLGSMLMVYGVLQGRAVAFFTGCTLSLFTLLQFLLVEYAVRRLAVRRRHSPHAVQGENLRVGLTLANFSRVPLLDVWVSEAAFPGGAVEKLFQVGEIIPPQRAYSFDYTCRISKPRGEYVLGPATVYVRDAFGIFLAHRRLPEKSPLRVYPTPSALYRHIPLLFHPLWRRIGEEVLAFSGASGDFRGPRAYRPGDMPAAMHWKATARYGVPIVKDFDGNAAAEVALFVDFRRSSLRGLGTRTTHESALGAAAAVLAAAVRRGHAVRALFVGTRSDARFHGSGTRTLHTILNAMVRLRPAMSRTDLAAAVFREIPSLPRGGTAVFVLGGLSITPEATAALARECRLHGVVPVALVFDERDFLRRDVHQMELDSRAPTFANVLNTYRRAGFRVYPIPTPSPQKLPYAPPADDGRLTV